MNLFAVSRASSGVGCPSQSRGWPGATAKIIHICELARYRSVVLAEWYEYSTLAFVWIRKRLAALSKKLNGVAAPTLGNDEDLATRFEKLLGVGLEQLDGFHVR
jgi:hypothetical protein